MKRVLVTGATGFIGRHCLPLLAEKGYEIHGISTKINKELDNDIYWHCLNLLEAGNAELIINKIKPTHLLHLAWVATPGKYWTALENFDWVRNSLDLLQAFRKYGGKRVVVTGTCAEYDWNYGYLSEHITPIQPQTVYGVCKSALQIMLESLAKETALSAAWARLFFIYGPHEHPQRLVPSVILSLLKNEPALCSHGEQIRDFLYVKDVAKALVMLLDNSKITGSLNIGSGQPIAIKNIITKIAQKLDKIELVRLNAIPAPINEPPLLIADNRRLEKEVEWQADFDWEAGLQETINWWQINIGNQP